MNEPYYQPVTPQAPPPYPPYAPAPKPKKSPVLGILLAIVVILAVLAVLLFVDPFKWNVVGNVKALLGIGGDPVAASIPPNPTMYVGFDLLNAQPDKLNRIVKPFADALNPSGATDAKSLQTDLDTQLKDAIGLTFTDDILPWAGPSAGVAVKDIKFGQYGTPTDMTLVFSIQSRDNAKADDFLSKLRSNVEAKNDIRFLQGTYSGVTIYSYAPKGSTGFGNEVAFARSGDVVLVSFTEAGIKAAIDAQKGDSLAKDSSYQDLVKQLPADRVFTFYMDAQNYSDLLTAMYSSTSTGLPSQYTNMLNDQMRKVNGFAFSGSIVDAGIQLDMAASYNLDKMTGEEQRAFAQSYEPLDTLKMLPEDTLFFLGGNVPNSTWMQLKDLITSMSGATADEFDQSMAQLEQEMGINPFKDLLPYIGGEVLIAGSPTTGGLLPQTANLNFGVVGLIESTDSGKVKTAVDKVSQVLKSQPNVSVKAQTAGDLSYYAVGEPSSNKDMLALGVGKQFLVFGTDPAQVEALYSGKSSLSNSTSYQVAVKALPNGSNPAFYIDVTNLIAKIRESMSGYSLDSFDQSVSFLKPIPAVIAGGSLVGNNIAKATFMILVTPAK